MSVRPVLLLALLSAVVAPARAQRWSFVVTGDGRADHGNPRPEDRNGVNVVMTTEIAEAVAKENPKFVLYSGDLVFGYTKTGDEFENELRTWIAAMSPLYDRHIPVLCCRGNHDAGAADSASVWRRVFSGRFSMPLNGPALEKDLTFSLRYRNALIVGLDEYSVGREAINQSWLDSVLTAAHPPLVFAMGHEAAFMDGSHKDVLDTDPIKRDAFWRSLIKAGARVFFCGHDHLYDHMVVVRAKGNPGPEMHQIVAGTAGAPFYTGGDYTGNNAGWKLTRVGHIDHTYGYLLVQIEGNKATITFKGRVSPGRYKPMDSFTYVARG